MAYDEFKVVDTDVWEDSKYLKVYGNYVSARPDDAVEGPSSSRWYQGQILYKTADEQKYIYINENLSLVCNNMETNEGAILEQDYPEEVTQQEIQNFLDFCMSVFGEEDLETYRNLILNKIFE